MASLLGYLLSGGRRAFCSLAFVVSSLAALVATTGLAEGEGLLTRDIGVISVECDKIHFVVSLNDDDDNRNGIPDMQETLPLKNARGQVVVEDNLREFDFTLAGAASVFIARPVIIATGKPALKVRVRAYESDQKTPFKFGRRPVPVTLYLEGVRESTAENDIGFEYGYYDKAKKSMHCGPGAEGTIERVDGTLTVAGGQGSPFERHRKMLIGGAAQAAVTVLRPITPMPAAWAYDGVGGAFAPPAALATTFTAGTAFTPVAPLSRIDLDRARLLLNFPRAKPAGQQIEVSVPINLTAPRRLEFKNKVPGTTQNSGWLDANPGTFDMINALFEYEFRDQENQKITESAYAGRIPQARENIGTVLTSPIAGVQNWINTSLRQAPNWTDHPDGKLSDRIQADGLQIDWIAQNVSGRRSFLPSLQVDGGVVMQIAPPAVHTWELSVNGDANVGATQNTFSATVTTRKAGGGTEVNITSVYTVHSP